MIKDIEYEELGKNIFPLQYLTEEEKKELGIMDKKCCRNNKQRDKNSCLSCSRCNMCCKQK